MVDSVGLINIIESQMLDCIYRHTRGEFCPTGGGIGRTLTVAVCQNGGKKRILDVRVRLFGGSSGTVSMAASIYMLPRWKQKTTGGASR